jgi:hypothetical protein
MAHSTAADVARRSAEEVVNSEHLDLADDLLAPDGVFKIPRPPGGVARGPHAFGPAGRPARVLAHR